MIFGEESTHAYHTSWYMVMRWRAAMKGDVISLTGNVEVDETYIGGKARNIPRISARIWSERKTKLQ